MPGKPPSRRRKGTGTDKKNPYLRHPIKPRVQETCEFAHRMGYQKLGVAFCAGLHKEAAALTQVLEAQGFEVVSVVCKAGCTPKETIGIGDEDKVRIGEFESMCSPIAQAMLLNEEKTDFNILLGLCVGHDSLFLKYARSLQHGPGDQRPRFGPQSGRGALHFRLLL